MTADEIAELRRVVSVKPLEWEERVGSNLTGYKRLWRAQTAFDWGYRVEEVSPKRYKLTHIGEYQGLDEAKAAAQADYEQRILSALTLAPAAGRAALACFPPGPPDVGEERPRRILFYPPGGRPAEVINVYTSDQATRLCDQAKRNGFRQGWRAHETGYSGVSGGLEAALIAHEKGLDFTASDDEEAIEALAEKKP